MPRDNQYVVYDPPRPSLPYLGVLYRDNRRLRVYSFATYEEAVEFLTSKALRKLEFLETTA